MPAAVVIAAFTLLTLMWAAMSFGAVYPWGYWPLIVGSAAIGLCGVVTAPRRVPGLRRVAAALAIVAIAITVQLIRIPESIIARANPARDTFLRRYDLLYAMSSPSTSHELSINPNATVIALSCFLAFSLLLLGTSCILSVRDAPRFLARGIVGFGLLLALFALAQNLAFGGETGEGHNILIYGFWPDPYVNKPFGPFINKNNYAGWMLMALPLALGYLAASVTRVWRSVHSDWRNRVLALSSRDGAQDVALFMQQIPLTRGGRKEFRDSRQQPLMPISHEQIDLSRPTTPQFLQEGPPAIFALARYLPGKPAPLGSPLDPLPAPLK